MPINDDIVIQSLQDDLNTDDNKSDPIMQELTDDPTKAFGIPADKFRDELAKLDTDSGDDDRREDIEDRDEDPEDVIDKT